MTWLREFKIGMFHETKEITADPFWLAKTMLSLSCHLQRWIWMSQWTLITQCQGLRDYKGQCKDLVKAQILKTEETQVAASKSPFRGVSSPWCTPLSAMTQTASWPLAGRWRGLWHTPRAASARSTVAAQSASSSSPCAATTSKSAMSQGARFLSVSTSNRRYGSSSWTSQWTLGLGPLDFKRQCKDLVKDQ